MLNPGTSCRRGRWRSRIFVPEEASFVRKRYDPPDTRQQSMRPRNAQPTAVTSDEAGVDYSTALLCNPELRCCTAEQHTIPPQHLIKAGLVKTCRILIRARVLTVNQKRTAGSPGQRMGSYSRSTVAPCGH